MGGTGDYTLTTCNTINVHDFHIQGTVFNLHGGANPRLPTYLPTYAILYDMCACCQKERTDAPHKETKAEVHEQPAAQAVLFFVPVAGK